MDEAEDKAPLPMIIIEKRSFVWVSEEERRRG
jgi:hypothetical protein